MATYQSKSGATDAAHMEGMEDLVSEASLHGGMNDMPKEPGHTNANERQLSEEEWARVGQTRRGLAARHVQLMAIGSAIGTGLFVGIGSVLSKAGPVSVFIGYTIWAFVYTWPLNLCVGEMAAYLPVRGAIYELAGRYVDPAFGFALGWVYFLAGVMILCVEYAAVATVMGYWQIDVNPAVWIAMALLSTYFLNVVAVRWYGESEFLMASTKILLILGLILLTFITMVGGNPRHDAYGFRNWMHGDAMHPYYTTGASGRFLGWFIVLRYAAFTTGGPDLIALASGEMQNPRVTIPRVAKLVFLRLMVFYVVGVFALGILCNSRNPDLLGAIKSGASGAAASPWVIGITNLGIGGLPTVINIVILLSGWSAGNAFLYSTSRALYSLARDGQAPKIFMKCTKSGVPVYSVTLVSLLSTVTFMVASESAVTVFWWFVNLATIAYLLVYTSYMVVYVCWVRACNAQGFDRTRLPYKVPYGTSRAYAGIALGCIVMIFLGWDAFVPWDTQNFVTSYFGIPFAIIVYFAYKYVMGTKIVDPATADIYSGKLEIDLECKHWEDGGFAENEKKRLAKMNFGRRAWEMLW